MVDQFPHGLLYLAHHRIMAVTTAAKGTILAGCLGLRMTLLVLPFQHLR